MRRAVFVAVLLCILALAGTAHAVTLDQGWYAQFRNVWLGSGTYDWEPCDPTSPVGQTGSLYVEEVASHGRRVSVTHSTDVAPGVIFEDWIRFAGAYPSYNAIQFGWYTSYDATRLQLRLYQHRSGGAQEELLWSQTASGNPANTETVWCSLQPTDGVVFRLVAVPEPSGVAALGIGALLVIRVVRRRRA